MYKIFFFLIEVRLEVSTGTEVRNLSQISSSETELSDFIIPKEQIRVDRILAENPCSIQKLKFK